jgi:hypothetical protein
MHYACLDRMRKKAYLVVKPFFVIGLHVIYFLGLWSTLCTHTCHISYILLLYCSEEEEFFDENFYACGPPVICLWHGALFCCLDLLVL